MGLWLLKLMLAVAGAYVAVVAALYFAQTWLLFPTGMVVASGPPLPASAERMDIATADGERLHGVRIPPSREQDGETRVMLGFGGNAWHADSVATYLHGLYPHAEVVAFHYRGYEPSTGRPSATALLEDALLVHDRIQQSAGEGRIVAVGLSVGAGVAAHLASRRELAGLILVSPFDSLQALARDHYPWAPVGWLLRHHIDTAASLRGVATPTALLLAERDTIVPPRRSEAVRQSIANLVLDRSIVGAGHNDLYGYPEFREAMVEALARIERLLSRQ